MPLVGANLAGYAINTVDVITLGRMRGTTELGYFTLANNIASWPLGLSQSILVNVSLPLLARVKHDVREFTRYLTTTLRASTGLFFFVAAMCAGLASPLVISLYGERWSAAAPALAILSVYGATRTVLALMFDALVASGSSRGLFWIQILWLMLLVPTMIVAVGYAGLQGAAAADAIVATAVILPVTLLAMRKASGVRVLPLAGALVWPTISALCSGFAAWATASLFPGSWAALIVGGLVGTAVYGGLMARPLLKLLAEIKGWRNTSAGGRRRDGRAGGGARRGHRHHERGSRMIVAQGVPAGDLVIQHAEIEEEVLAGFSRIFASSGYILGPETEAFEQAYAAYCRVAHTIGVASGTDAIEIAVRAAGIGRGDEVIVPTNTFVATAEGVIRAGATPVLVDCDEYFLIDAERAADAITRRTRAIIGVNLYGQIARIEALRSLAPDRVIVFEDAAQSQGATRNGEMSGSLGRAAATSFYPGKNLGAYGDAGAITTDDPEIDMRARRIRNHGGLAKYEHAELGTTSRLDAMQAVVLSAKLRRLDAWNAQRRAAAARYDELLADLPVTTPQVVPGNEHVYHQYVVRVANRDDVLARLNSSGVAAALHYASPLHRLASMRFLEADERRYPTAEAYSREILSLPIFPGITHGQQILVAEELGKAVAS